MAQISDRSPHRGCEQGEGTKCVSSAASEKPSTVQRCTRTLNMVLEGRWLWHGLHHVPSQQKWHMTGLGGMGSSWGVTLQWDEWEDRSLQPEEGGEVGSLLSTGTTTTSLQFWIQVIKVTVLAHSTNCVAEGSCSTLHADTKTCPGPDHTAKSASHICKCPTVTLSLVAYELVKMICCHIKQKRSPACSLTYCMCTQDQ